MSDEQFPVQDDTATGGDNNGILGTATNNEDHSDAQFDASKLVEGPGGVMMTIEDIKNYDNK